MGYNLVLKPVIYLSLVVRQKNDSNPVLNCSHA